MRHFISISGVLVLTNTLLAASLPVITTQPQNQVVSPGVTATLSVAASDATSFQWRFNGADISGATNSTLQVPNAQTNNSGYYMVVAKNATGWVPSQMGYLSVVSSSGTVPFSNATNTGFYAQAMDPWTGSPINNGNAQVVAGPALDQMQPIAGTAGVTNGYFSKSPFPWVSVTTVAPGKRVYYRVDIAYTNIFFSGTLKQQSAVLDLVAGLGPFPFTSTGDLKFPAWPEWPEPYFFQSGGGGLFDGLTSAATNQVRIVGESFCLTNLFWGYGDLGVPTWQWRKDGTNIGSPQYFTGSFFSEFGVAVLSITNAQPADSGIYDVVVLGNNWFIGPKITLSIQVTNGQGLFLSPRINGSNFISDLQGVAGRNYAIQWSSNLTVWNDLWTLSNLTGTITFTNFPATIGTRFYRSILLP